MSRQAFRLPFLVLVCGLVLIPIQHALASSFQVTTTTDSIDLHPGDGVCDDGSGACSLRAAIMETNALPGDDWISVPPGTYMQTLNTPAETGANVGDLDITDNLTIQGSGAEATIVSGHVLDRVFQVRVGITVSLSGLTITGGDAHSNRVNALGGNIFNEGGNLTITDCIISDGMGYGGGIANTTSGTVHLRSSRVENNRGAGGISNDRGSMMTIEQSQITGNRSLSSGGGISNGGTLVIQDSTVSGNSAYTHSGGINNIGSLTLNHVAITGNSARFRGGAMYSIAGTTVITGSTITGNTSLEGGSIDIYGARTTATITDSVVEEAGGIAVMARYSAHLTLQNVAVSNSNVGVADLYAMMTIHNSTIRNNHKGIHVYRGDLEMSGSTVADNHNLSEYSGGGGLLIMGSLYPDAITIRDTVFENNSAMFGAGIHVFRSPLTLENVILRNNSASHQGGGLYANIASVTITNSAIIGNQAAYSGDALYFSGATKNALNLTGNCIQGNGATSVYSNAGKAQNVTGNWWGSPDGPSGAGPGSGDSVSPRLDFSAWLTAPPAACGG